jgi:hypothetical protein
MSTNELRRLRAILVLFHDEIHHPGTVNVSGEDVDLLMNIALKIINHNLKTQSEAVT